MKYPPNNRSICQVFGCFFVGYGRGRISLEGNIYLPWGSTNMGRMMEVSTIFRSPFGYHAGTGAKPAWVERHTIFPVPNEMGNAHNA